MGAIFGHGEIFLGGLFPYDVLFLSPSSNINWSFNCNHFDIDTDTLKSLSGQQLGESDESRKVDILTIDFGCVNLLSGLRYLSISF